MVLWDSAREPNKKATPPVETHGGAQESQVPARSVEETVQSRQDFLNRAAAVLSGERGLLAVHAESR